MAGKRPFTEIESVHELIALLKTSRDLRDVVVQGLDLRSPGVDRLIRGTVASGAYFLGCRLTPEAEDRIRSTGGTLFPVFHGLPFNPYRSTLYTPQELMDGYVVGNQASIDQTLDNQIYRLVQKHYASGRPPSILASLAFRIHDHAIDDALVDLLSPGSEHEKRVVGVMGGHSLRRDDPRFASVAEIGYRLATAGYFVATGGGPGAMEAANLGAYFAGTTDANLKEAIDLLRPSPHYSDEGYVDRSFDVTSRFTSGVDSLAIPTWFYGHEPGNLFSTSIAKYFANSIREDGLLAVATQGVIYAPGSAGTVQEIFMDAAQNHYESVGMVSPMVFLDREYWTVQKPVMPLLEALASDRRYANYLALVDEPSEAVDFIIQNPPLPSKRD